MHFLLFMALVRLECLNGMSLDICNATCLTSNHVFKPCEGEVVKQHVKSPSLYFALNKAEAMVGPGLQPAVFKCWE